MDGSGYQNQEFVALGQGLNWAHATGVLQPNRFPNTTHNEYGLTSAHTLPPLSPNNADTVIPWNPQIENFVPPEPDGIISIQETSYCPRSSKLRDDLLAFATPSLDVVNSIMIFLEPLFASVKHSISGIRASKICVLQTGDVLPMVQWQEGADREAIALFEVEQAKFCNSLIHYGDGTTFQPDGTRWRNCRIKWRVRDFERLRALLVILWPAVGRQQVPEDDLERRLFNPSVQESIE